MEDGSNLHRELLFASSALPPLLIRQPENVSDLAAARTGDFAIGPTHCRDFINANLLIAKVLNSVYESGWVCHKQNTT
jgi:hypothetical protein